MKMQHPQVRCAVAVGNTLGEGIVWCPQQQCLYWTDIEAAVLWRHHPASHSSRSWALPERLSCLALCQDSQWLLLGLATQLAFFHLPSARLQPICRIEEGLPTRLNDGGCDREGRFVFGTLHEPPQGQARQPLGAWYRLDPDLRVQRLGLDKVATSNALAFSPDGRTMYFCDSPTRIIRRCAYSPDGEPGPAQDWVDLRGIDGVPDGACVDAEGGLWNAQWGMGRVVRYTPEGREDIVLPVAAPCPTRPALGGAALDTLYITSAQGKTAADRTLQSGHVFAARVPIQGLAESRFAGRPSPSS